jgi:hypothetical protein
MGRAEAITNRLISGGNADFQLRAGLLAALYGAMALSQVRASKQDDAEILADSIEILIATPRGNLPEGGLSHLGVRDFSRLLLSTLAAPACASDSQLLQCLAGGALPLSPARQLEPGFRPE